LLALLLDSLAQLMPEGEGARSPEGIGHLLGRWCCVLAIQAQAYLLLDEFGIAGAEAFVLCFHLHVVALPAFDLLV
jgi:hypothetical protein